MIYGTARDLNMHKLLRVLSRAPFFPVFGNGIGLMQPVHVEDLAQGLLLAVKNSGKSEYSEYNVVGRYPQTYNEIVREAAAAVGKPVTLVHLPAKPSLWGAALAERVLGARSPMTAEQVLRLSEDKCFSWSAARGLGYDPRPFREGIRAEAHSLRALGLLPPPVSNP
jgi:nucleoside-diphosphate-sugar epimerase